jgi:hypothetical protein
VDPLIKDTTGHKKRSTILENICAVCPVFRDFAKQRKIARIIEKRKHDFDHINYLETLFLKEDRMVRDLPFSITPSLKKDMTIRTEKWFCQFEKIWDCPHSSGYDDVKGFLRDNPLHFLVVAGFRKG